LFHRVDKQIGKVNKTKAGCGQQAKGPRTKDYQDEDEDEMLRMLEWKVLSSAHKGHNEYA